MPKTDTNANGHLCICDWRCRVLCMRIWCREDCPKCHPEHSTQAQRTKRSKAGRSKDVNKTKG